LSYRGLLPEGFGKTLKRFKESRTLNTLYLYFSQIDTRLMKKACLKIQIMIDTKIILNTKKNTPFDIISRSNGITRLQVLKSGGKNKQSS
jgi:hypothetical protein